MAVETLDTGAIKKAESRILSDIPKTWTKTTLGECFKWGSGGTPKSGISNYYGGSIPWLVIGDLNDGIINKSGQTITEQGLENSSAKLVDEGTLLLAMYGSIGKLGIAGMKLATNQAIAFAEKNEIETKYIFSFLRYARSQLSELGKGATQQNISQTVIKAFPFPLAPLNEQKRIVAKIEELFSELDNGVAALKTAREQLKVYRQAVLKHAFEGKLTAKWREENADKLESPEQLLARIQQEREARYQQQLEDWEAAVKKWEEQGKEGKKPGKPKAQDTAILYHFPSDYYLANMPADWACLKAEHLCDFITKGTTPAKNELFANTGDIPFIKVYNLTKNGALDFSIDPTFVSAKTHNEFLARSKVYPNDVLMNIVGPPLGKVSIVPSTHSEWNINQAIAIYRSAALLPKYLSEFLLFEKTVNYMMAQSKATAGQFNLTLEICRDLPIPVPSFEEQAEIVRTLEAQLSNVDSISQEIEIQLTKSETLRQSILKKAFSGQLVQQDPNDEPASALLARIQAEKAKQKVAAKPKATAKPGAKRSRKPRQEQPS